MIEADSVLWSYLSDGQKALAHDGALLLAERVTHPNEKLSDSSYLVFPYAKLYEGFLKQLLLDLHIISDGDYASEHFRVGKVLSPNLARLLREKSAYTQLVRTFGSPLANELWLTWKQGRNLIFHYFPHNLQRISLSEAQELIRLLVRTMEYAVAQTHVHRESP